MGETNIWKSLLAEFIGTFLLVLIGAGTVAYLASTQSEYTLTIALVFGLVMAVIVYLFGCISGSHVNPAVSLGFALVKRMDWVTMIMYWIAQFLGGILAAALIYWLFNKQTGASTGSLTNTDQWKAVFVEALITTILVLVFLCISKNWKVGLMAGVILGCVLAFNYIFAGNLTGASANPARSLGPAIIGSGNMGSLWIYFVGPIIGAIVAAIIYSIFNMSAYQVVKDCNGQPIVNGCCDKILVKECPMKDNCGNPVKDNCGNPVTFKKYKIDESKKHSYKLFRKKDCFSKHGHSKWAHKALCQEGLTSEDLQKVGPNSSAYESDLGLKDLAMDLLGKQQQQKDLAEFVSMKSVATGPQVSIQKSVTATVIPANQPQVQPSLANLTNSIMESRTSVLNGSALNGTALNGTALNTGLSPVANTGLNSAMSSVSRPFTASTSMSKAFSGTGVSL